MDSVPEWLEQLGLGEYVAVFDENAIDEEILPDLTETDLKDLGIVKLGHRKKILKAITALRGGAEVEAAALQAPTDASLSVSQPSEAERRQLTVMFCDLVGSTELSQRLDPEDLSDINRAYQDACKDAIDRYDGYVARYMGDGVLAYFGYPQAHEDDAERGVRAGLAILESMAPLNANIAEAHEVELAARIGVATGPVVVGDMIGEGAAEEAAVVGETPNLAARLQTVAEPNQVMIAPTTQRLLGALFEYQDAGTHEFKGIEQRVPVWRVVGEGNVDSRFEAKRFDSGLPLVGRQEELGLLLRSWESSKEGHGQAVLIQGDAGIGKSRLIEALRERLSEQNYIWVARRCSPYHANSSLYPVIEHIKRAMGWTREDGPEQKLEKLEAALGRQSLPLEEAVPLYAALMSLPLPEGRYVPMELSAQQRREQTLDALAGWLLDEAESTPVLNVWEDLHWADPTTLELLGIYIDQSPTVSMLNVLTYRSEFVPPWSMHSHMTPITLNRLERPEVETLIGHQARGKQLPSEVVDQIVAKADGVPLYVEELTKTILDSEFLRDEGNRYTLAGAFSDFAIPATLKDSLMARLDRLPTLREVAQLGAVLGREFAYEMLQLLAPMEEPVLNEGLGQLVEEELLYQRGRPPRARYIFKHALIRDAAYQSLLRRTRQQYHQQVAALMVERFPETVAAQPEIVAHHFAEAGCVVEAIGYFCEAGQQARGRFANLEAVTHFENALQLMPQLPETPERQKRELEIQMALGAASVPVRGYADSGVGKAYARAWVLCQQLDDVDHLHLILRGRQIFEFVRGKFDKAREAADEFVALAERQQDPALVVGSCHALGQILCMQGDLIAARKVTERGIDLFDPERHRLANWPGGQPGEQCHLYAAFSLWMLGYPDLALNRAEEALAMANELANPANLINTLAFLAHIHVLRMEPVAANQRAAATMELCTEHKNPHFLGHATVLHGWSEAAQGQVGEGIAEIERGITTFRSTGAVSTWLPNFFALHAESLAQANRANDGLACLEEALAIVDRTGEHCWHAELLRVEGELILARAEKDHAQAESSFTQALDIARHQKAKSWELRAATSLGRLWKSQGRHDEIRDLIEPVYDWFSEGLDTADLQEAKALLGSLAGHR